MTNTSPAQCRFCADHYLSYRCLLLPAGALIDAAIAGVEDDASIAAAAEFAFMQRDRITVANEIMQYHPVPPGGCDCPNPTRCVHYAQQAERDAGARWAAEEPYRLQIADEAGRAEVERRSGDYAERMAEERARLLGQSPDGSEGV